MKFNTIWKNKENDGIGWLLLEALDKLTVGKYELSDWLHSLQIQVGRLNVYKCALEW